MDNKDNELAKLAGNEGFVSMDRILELQAEAKSNTAGAAKGGETSLEGLTRYDGYCSYDGGGPAEMEVDKEGEYVKFDDVVAHLAGQSQATKVQAVPADWLLRSLVADLLHLLPVTFEFAELDRATGEAVVAKLRAMLANPTAQEVTLLTYWKAQRAMIERTIIGLRDGWATRKDAADALVTLAAATPVSEEVTQQAAKAETAEHASLNIAVVGWLMEPSGTVWGSKADADAVMAASMSQTKLVPLVRADEAELASRCRAQGGADKPNSSDLAPTTSTATASGSAPPIMFGERPVENMQIDLLARCLKESSWFDGDGLEKAWNELVAFYVAHRESASAQASQAAASDEVREKVRDAVAVALDGVYTCGRVWSAWGYGTMSQNDFAPAGEDDDVLDNVVSAVFAALRTNPATPASKGGA